VTDCLLPGKQSTNQKKAEDPNPQKMTMKRKENKFFLQVSWIYKIKTTVLACWSVGI